MSPYAFCNNNPLRFTDPNGMSAEDTIEIKYTEKKEKGNDVNKSVTYKDDKAYNDDGTEFVGCNDYVTKVVSNLNEIKYSGNRELAKRLNTLETSENVHTIENVDAVNKVGNSNNPNNFLYDVIGVKTGSKAEYNPDKLTDIRGAKRNPIIPLVHELLGHGYDSDQGKSTLDKTSNGIPMNEVNAIRVENLIRPILKEPKRDTFGGKKISVDLLNLKL